MFNFFRRINTATFVDMHVDCVDSNNLYIATNSSNILHAICIGNRANPAMYKTIDSSKSSVIFTKVLLFMLFNGPCSMFQIDPCGNVTCLETCPFEHPFFLVRFLFLFSLFSCLRNINFFIVGRL